MTYRRTQTCWMVVICLLFAGLPGSASADVDVRQLTLTHNGVFTELIVHVPGRLLSNHFIEEPKAGRPFRLVVDFSGAVHQLGQKNFEDLPSEFVARIRTSQYATTPQNVVRVVLDLKREVTYKVSVEPEAVIISLVTPGEPEFEPWSSSSTVHEPVSIQQRFVVDEAVPSETVKDEKSRRFLARSYAPYNEAKSPKPVVAVKEQISESLAPAEPVIPEEDKVVSIVPPAESPAEEWTALNPNQVTSETTKQVWVSAPQIEITENTESQSTVSEPQMEPETIEVDVAPAVEGKQRYAAVVQYDVPIGPEWKQEPAQEPTEPRVEETPALAEVELPESPEPTEEDAVTRAETPSEEESPIPVQDPVEPVASGGADSDEDLPLLARLQRKFFGPADDERVAADPDSAALARIKALAAISDEPASDDRVTEDREQAAPPTRHVDREELESKIAVGDPDAVASIHAATDGGPIGGETNQRTAWKGTPVRTDAARREVTYERAGRRDPFHPLIEGQRSGLWTTALPRVDALRLVGILEDYDGTVALFEDMEGYGYILHEDDPVKNGHVKTIGKNRVVFHIDDFGWVHTVVLQLQRDASMPVPDWATEFDDE